MRFAFLALFFGTLLIVGLGDVSVIDYDEACYAEIARVMKDSGDFLVPVLGGEPFFEKPPFLYWSMAAGYSVLGTNAWGARILNALAALALILWLYRFLVRTLGEREAFWSAFVLGTSLGVLWLGRMAMTDMILTLWLMMAMTLFFDAVETNKASRFWFACACCGLAMLTKGAIGLVFPAIAAFVYLAWLGKLRLLFKPSWLAPGAAIALLVGFSWYILVGITHDDGFGFARSLFWEHHVGRFLNPMQGHEGPVFYYIPVLILTLFPWSPFLLCLRGSFGWKKLQEQTVSSRWLALMFTFGVMVFLFFSTAATKLPNYIMPAIPCFGIMVGLSLARRIERAKETRDESKAWRSAFFLSATVCVLIGAAMIALRELLSRQALSHRAHKVPALANSIDLGWGPILVCGILVLGVLLAIYHRRKSQVGSSFRTLGLSSALGLFALWLTVLPTMEKHLRLPLQELAHEAHDSISPGEELVLIGIRRVPSLTFYTGLSTRYVGRKKTDDLAKLFHQEHAEIALVAEANLSRLEGLGPFEELKRLGGYVLVKCGGAS